MANTEYFSHLKAKALQVRQQGLKEWDIANRMAVAGGDNGECGADDLVVAVGDIRKEAQEAFVRMQSAKIDSQRR